MTKEENVDVSKKLNVLIAVSLRLLMGDKEFARNKRQKRGVGDLVRYLGGMGLNAKDIADILGAPVQSVRTLLTPNRRK